MTDLARVKRETARAAAQVVVPARARAAPAARRLPESARAGFQFRLGGNLSPVLARAAKEATSHGALTAGQAGKLREPAGAGAAGDLFLAGLLDEENARLLQRTKLGAGTALEFSLASIRSGMSAIKRPPRHPRATASAAVPRAGAKPRVARVAASSPPPAGAPLPSIGAGTSHYEETKLPDGRIELHAWGTVGDAIERPGLETKHPLPGEVGLPGCDRWHLAGPDATGSEEGIAYTPKNFNIGKTATVENVLRRARAAVQEQGGEISYDFRAIVRPIGDYEGVNIRILEEVTWNADIRAAGGDRWIPLVREPNVKAPLPATIPVLPSTPVTPATPVTPKTPPPSTAQTPPTTSSSPEPPLKGTTVSGGASVEPVKTVPVVTVEGGVGPNPAAGAKAVPVEKATVGMPDMEPVHAGGLDPTGTALGEGGVVALQGLNFLLNWANAVKQLGRVKEALAATEPRIAELRKQNPESGVLVVIYFRQVEGHPDSPIQPGPTFDRIELGLGRDPRAAEHQRAASPSLRAGLARGEHEIVGEMLWVPAISPQADAPPKPPLPVAGLATFASRTPVLQDVEWTNMGGFDDEGTTKLTLAEGVEARFYVLQLPATIESIIPFETNPEIKKTTLPLAVRNGLPVVDLDPVMPFSHVVAAALFPADQPTLELFAQAPATVQNGPLLVKDFDLVRWARPEQIRSLGR